MKSEEKLLLESINSPEIYKLISPKVAQLVGIDKEGKIQISFDNTTSIVAKLVYGLDMLKLAEYIKIGGEVLVVFENGDPNKPIIIALMEDPEESISLEEKLEEKKADPIAAVVEHNRVNIKAEDEIHLTCGESQIILRKDGKIIVKGKNILSRAKEKNKIKGGSVSIN
jgi:hypothetical protein